MKLTPVKIRGKGGRKKAWQPPKPSQLKRQRDPSSDDDDDDTTTATTTIPGNGSNHDTKPEIQEPKRRLKRVKKKSSIALIEQLPTEIIERIFLMSENLDLPRSSLRIGYLLSARPFLKELILAAFAPTWDVWFGCDPLLVQSYTGWRTDGDRFGGNPKFQVRCRRRIGQTLNCLCHVNTLTLLPS